MVLLKCCWNAGEVPFKCRWSAVEVQTANSQQPQPHTFPMLTPPLPTVGWSKTARFLQSWRKKFPRFFCWKLCHPRPILGIRSSTRSLHNLQKFLISRWRRQTNKQTDMATLWLDRPRGLIQWKVFSDNYFFICTLSSVFYSAVSCAQTAISSDPQQSAICNRFQREVLKLISWVPPVQSSTDFSQLSSWQNI